jgi:hypothetical protein
MPHQRSLVYLDGASSNSAFGPQLYLNFAAATASYDLYGLVFLVHPHKFHTLFQDVRQLGLDDQIRGLEWFREQRILEGERLLQGCSGTVLELRSFARTGIPVCLRSR